MHQKLKEKSTDNPDRTLFAELGSINANFPVPAASQNMVQYYSLLNVFSLWLVSDSSA
jgi:hypothetical protein